MPLLCYFDVGCTDGEAPRALGFSKRVTPAMEVVASLEPLRVYAEWEAVGRP